MSTSAAEFQFVAEFVAFLVATAGLALVTLGSGILARATWARVLLTGGFAALAVAAFAHGSLLAGDDVRLATAVVRGLGLAALVGGALRWRGSVPSARLLWAGIAGTAAAAVVLGIGQRGEGNVESQSTIASKSPSDAW